MKIIFKFLILSFTLLFFQSITETRTISSIPVYYPQGIIGTGKPYIIWFDRYNDKDLISKAKYKVTMIPGSGKKIEPVLIMPETYNKSFYYFKFPFTLSPGKYSYTIERLINNKSVNSKYFYYLKYPVKGGFFIDPDKKSRLNELKPEFLIQYLSLEKENKMVNRYNCIFYGAGSICSFGIGLLFYKILDFGLISSIISTIAFTSSAVGVGASGYYGYNYYNSKNQLRKIIDIDSNVSINSRVSLSSTYADFKISF